MTHRAALVVNVAARSGRSAFARARDLLLETDLDLGWCRAVAPHELRAALREAALHGHGRVVVGGGDGTLGLAARVFSDLPAAVRPALGVLPLGTANDFARTLGIPRRLQDAVAVAATGKVVDVDLGRANGSAFLNAASLGLSVEAGLSVEPTHGLRPGLERVVGRLARPAAIASARPRHVPLTARLTFPEGDHETLELSDLLQITVGNGRYHGGGHVLAPDAGIDDDRLDVFLIRRGRLRDHVEPARPLRDGTLVRHRQVQHLTTRAVQVTTSDGSGALVARGVNLDGEVTTTTPVLFEVESDVIDVVVPEHVTHLRRDAVATAAETD